MPKEYEISTAQLKTLKDARCVETFFEAWQVIGDAYGFNFWTVKYVTGKSFKFFTAETLKQTPYLIRGEA